MNTRPIVSAVPARMFPLKVVAPLADLWIQMQALGKLAWNDVAEPARRPHVLLADDEPCLLRACAVLLAAEGYEVTTAVDGDAAAARLEERRFDLILADIDMPRMSGLQLLQHVRAANLDVPVVLMTGGPDVATAVRALEYGAYRYLIKPVDRTTLLDTVRDGTRPRRARVRPISDERDHHRHFDRALARLWMAYQPIHSWPGQAIYAREALVRSDEPGLDNPGLLFAAAQRLGRLAEIGRTIRALVAADAPRLTDAPIFVNLHPEDLMDGELYDPAAPLSRLASRVVLEITERATLDDVVDLRGRIAQLRDLGFRIAIDDLGAGYSGLSAFVQLRPDVVKLDASLVRGIEAEPTKAKLVASLTRLCADMRLLMVAEGVETVAERDTLIGLGCNLLQGYLFARPARL